MTDQRTNMHPEITMPKRGVTRGLRKALIAKNFCNYGVLHLLHVNIQQHVLCTFQKAIKDDIVFPGKWKLLPRPTCLKLWLGRTPIYPFMSIV